MNDFHSRFLRFMEGRYGLRGLRDFMQITLYVVYFLLAVLRMFVPSPVIFVIQWLVIAYSLFRILSKNIPARENESRIMGIWLFKMRDALRFRRADLEERKHKRAIRQAEREERKRKRTLRRQNSRQDKTHIFRDCPACGATLRLPRKKGKHETRCPRCGHTFAVRCFKA